MFSYFLKFDTTCREISINFLINIFIILLFMKKFVFKLIKFLEYHQTKHHSFISSLLIIQ